MRGGWGECEHSAEERSNDILSIGTFEASKENYAQVEIRTSNPSQTRGTEEVGGIEVATEWLE